MNPRIRILIIDDEKDMLSGCKKILDSQGYATVPVSDPKFALNLLEEESFDLVLCDLLMPQMAGMDVLKKILSRASNMPVIMFSAYGTIDRAVDAMKAGAFDFIEKPFDGEHLKLVVKKAIDHSKLFKERNSLLDQLEDKYKFDNIIGKSNEMRKVFELVATIAKSDANVLITGESGTGKELIARSIHAYSPRKLKPFVPVNCSAFPENLFESELFGYEKGAFTGANKNKMGLLEYANEGVFFFDEICELPLPLQSKLLRTLQDKKLRHIGGNELITVDVRIISATNKDMFEKTKEGKFREDLYYRLNVINVHLPPLRDRREDIRILASHFLDKYSKSSHFEIEGFSDEVFNKFESYNWPGNVRELENVVERAVALSKGGEITLNEISHHISGAEKSAFSFDSVSLADAKQRVVYDIEKKYLEYLLAKHRGNVTKIAEEAKMTRRNIHRLLKIHGFNQSQWRTSNND